MPLCFCMVPAASCSIAFSLNISKWQNENCKYESSQPMTLPNLWFCSISRKENQTYQQRHAFRKWFLPAILCSNDNSSPKYNRKMLIRIRTFLPDESCFNYEPLFHPAQCTAGKLCQCNSIKILFFPRASGHQSISDQIQNHRGINGCRNGTRWYSTCLHQFSHT